MKARATLSVLFLTVIALAGCAGDEPANAHGGEGRGGTDQQLKAGMGAIAGLLVDDRFRPLHLVDNPNGEFQTRGFVLLHELGIEARTNANGEFSFVDIPPGSYTLRTQVSGHEGTPQSVQVQAGAYSEASIVVRRVTSEGSTILTQEFTVFIDCWIPFWTELNCFLDMSLDSKRAGFTTDYTAVEDITYLRAEFLFDKAGSYDGDVGVCEGESFTERWATANSHGTDYASILMTADRAQWDNRTEDSGLAGWLDSSRVFCTVVWPGGQAAQYGVPLGDLVGFGVSTKAQVVQSVFLGEPDVDVQAYCVLC